MYGIKYLYSFLNYKIACTFHSEQNKTKIKNVGRNFEVVLIIHVDSCSQAP
jgi:hypothetical protein